MKLLSATRGFPLVKSLLCVCIVAMAASSAHAQSMKVEAKLLWCTDDPQSPNPKHHPLEAELTRRLKHSPYRWKNYFEENHQTVEIPVGETKSKIVMSEHCTLDIKNLGNDRVEVRLHGNGKPVSIHQESLAKNGLLVLGGEAANETAWLVTIRKALPPHSMPAVGGPVTSSASVK